MKEHKITAFLLAAVCGLWLCGCSASSAREIQFSALSEQGGYVLESEGMVFTAFGNGTQKHTKMESKAGDRVLELFVTPEEMTVTDCTDGVRKYCTVPTDSAETTENPMKRVAENLQTLDFTFEETDAQGSRFISRQPNADTAQTEETLVWTDKDGTITAVQYDMGGTTLTLQALTAYAIPEPETAAAAEMTEDEAKSAFMLLFMLEGLV